MCEWVQKVRNNWQPSEPGGRRILWGEGHDCVEQTFDWCISFLGHQSRPREIAVIGSMIRCCLGDRCDPGWQMEAAPLPCLACINHEPSVILFATHVQILDQVMLLDEQLDLRDDVLSHLVGYQCYTRMK